MIILVILIHTYLNLINSLVIKMIYVQQTFKDYKQKVEIVIFILNYIIIIKIIQEK